MRITTTPKWVKARIFCWIGCLLFVTIAGCTNSKKSLYEEIDHETPAHWPSDMSDAAGKMSTRLNALKAEPGNQAARSELVDLVSWSAEVAADTNITEQNWMPIYEQSESLRKQLLKGADVESLADDVQRLCETLQAANQSLSPKPTL